MKVILRVTDSGPISLRSGREATGAQTITYIPGRSVLGGLAEAHNELRHNSNEFNKFFLAEKCAFGNLYPADFTSEELQGNIDAVLPIPATAMSCKRFGGFVFDEEDPTFSPHHGVYDTLIPRALFALDNRARPELLGGLSHCRHDSGCREPMDGFHGFYRRSAWDSSTIGTSQITQGLRTRTGISRQTGTVEKGILYSREILGPGMRFWGTASIEDTSFDAFRIFVQEANAAAALRFGSNRTRGMGRAVMEVDKVDIDTADTIVKRIAQFNEIFRTQAANFKVTVPHSLYVPLTLSSDVVLLDRLLRYQTCIDGDYLQNVWHLPGAELIYQNNSTRRVMGWQSLLRVPRADAIAIAMGSVFLIGFSTPLNEQITKMLLQMQNEGIGARLREGFGRVVVANSFHWEVQGQ